MTGAYAMGAPWARFAGRCGPEWSALSDWLAKMTGHPKMTGHHGSRGQHPFGQWGMFGAPPRLVRRLDHGGVQVAAGAVPRPAAVIFGRQFLASSRSSP